MIEDVEELGTEAKSQTLRQVKLLLYSNVRLPCAKTPQHIASEITLRTGRRRTKSGAIEDLAAGKLRAMDLERYTRVEVGAGSELCSGREETSADNVNRRRRSGVDETIERPAAQNRFDSVP